MLFKNMIRKIKHSLGRYFSLLLIILIGIGFYAGITVSIPSIKNLQKNYYQKTNLMDLAVRTNYGITDNDINELKKINNVKVEGAYSEYVISGEDVIKVLSITKKINRYQLVSGRNIKNNNECLADSRNYKIGDTITVKSNYLKETTFKVVGTIRTPLFSGNNYGYTNIGSGKLKSFIYVNKDIFTYPTYTEAYISMNKDKTPYTDEYKKEIKKLKKKINDKYTITDRTNEVTCYLMLENQYKQVLTIASIIPIFFIVIVFLMTSNTMSRMISEERGEMGTLSSLGISNKKIIITYLTYVLSSTILGVIIGYFIGTLIIPILVYTCFPFNMPNIKYYFDFKLLLGCLIVSLILMFLVTFINCKKSLKDKPAKLLRPLAPKSGKKLLIEKSKLWSKVSFSLKVTIRNIARYKKRVIMTLIGSAGCTVLVLIGFAIKDSITGVGDIQYNDIFRYDNLMVLNNKLDTDKVKDIYYFNQYTYDIKYEKDNKTSVYTIVGNDNKLFYKYFNLKDYKNGNKLKLKNGVIITKKLSEKLKAKVGSYITIQSSDKTKKKVKVDGIAENYIGNYIYISKNTYNNLFGNIAYNMAVSKNNSSEKKITDELLSNNKIITISFSKDLAQTANNEIKGLNQIVALLVIVSSMLSITVLYNLTSINISERKREIATLKVLGFTGKESNGYIYRETLIIVIIGILLGLLIGPYIHRFIIGYIEGESMTFLKTINILSFVYAGILNLLFALIMMIVTYFKLKQIDMISSLKSVE